MFAQRAPFLSVNFSGASCQISGQGSRVYPGLLPGIPCRKQLDPHYPQSAQSLSGERQMAGMDGIERAAEKGDTARNLNRHQGFFTNEMKACTARPFSKRTASQLSSSS